MRRPFVRVALASASALALVISAGCSEGDDKALDAVLVASDRTIAAESAQVAIVVTTQVNGAPATLTGDGGFDLAAGQGVLSLNLGALLAGAKLEARVVGDTAYVAPPAFLVGLVGKPFLKVDLALLATEVPQFGAISSTANPVAAVNALRGAADAAEVGAEVVRGEQTTHYEGTLALTAAAEALEAGSAVALERLRTLLGRDEVPYDVWLDEAGRVRRLALRISAPASSASPASPVSAPAATTGATVTTELYDYGASVEVVAPAADQVADGNAFLRSISGPPAG